MPRNIQHREKITQSSILSCASRTIYRCKTVILPATLIKEGPKLTERSCCGINSTTRIDVAVSAGTGSVHIVFLRRESAQRRNHSPAALSPPPPASQLRR